MPESTHSNLKQVIFICEAVATDQLVNRNSSFTRDFKLDRMPRLSLHDCPSVDDESAMKNVFHTNLKKITATQFAIYS